MKQFDSVIDAILLLEFGGEVTTEKALELLSDYKDLLVKQLIEIDPTQTEASVRRILRSIVAMKRMDYERR